MAQSTTARLPEQRKPFGGPRVRGEAGLALFTTARLAFWQLRRTWRLLLLVSAGLLLSGMVVCAIPLYALIAESAGLRHALESDPQNMYITVHSTNSLFSRDALNSAAQDITQELQSTLGTTVAGVPDLSVQISTLAIGQNAYLRLVGTDTQQAGTHLKLLKGRLPEPASDNVIEFAVTSAGLQMLHLRMGEYLHVPYGLFDAFNVQAKHTLTLHLVGVFAGPDVLFWHGETFAPEAFSQNLQPAQRLPVMVDNVALMNALSDLSARALQRSDGEQLANPSDTYWYYRFDFSHLAINRLAALTDHLKAALTVLQHNPETFPTLMDTTAGGPLAIFQDYNDRVTVLGPPVFCLAFSISGLILFFVVLLTGLLIERQGTTITLLRERGASVRQLAGALLWQGAGASLLAGILAPFLALALVQVLAGQTLAPIDRVAFDLITADRWSIILELVGLDLLVISLAFVAMVLAAWRTLYRAHLFPRRQGVSASERPLWTRINRDLPMAAGALVGFGFSLYLANPYLLDVRTHISILPVTMLGGLLFLLLAILILCLRLAPILPRLGQRLAARGRGIAPLLALEQMTRAPRQSLRMQLLLALAIAFALFTLIFSQTQQQRLHDLAAYRTGGDLSGTLPTSQQNLSWDQLLNWYHHLNGVTAVTPGYTQQMTGGSGQSLPFDLRAVDISTYASTVYWTPQDGNQSITALAGELRAQRSLAVKKNIIPAIIDDAAARSLNVAVGQQFVLRDFHGPLDYRVVAIVHFIPTVYDHASRAASDSPISHGGVLTDYQTTSAVALAVNQEIIGPTTVWLRTSDNPALLANVRHTLLTGPNALDNPADRRELDAVLSSDPLYASLTGILWIGAVVALLLGLPGNLLVSWLNARERRAGLALLRALGGTPRQLAAVLLWEQSLVYGSALVLGTLLGLLFTWLILPAFIFSPLAGVDIVSAGDAAFYLVQSVPAVHVSVPCWSIVALLAALLGLCALALPILIGVSLRSQIRQALRVDRD